MQIAAVLDYMLENLVGLKSFGHFNFIAIVKTVVSSFHLNMFTTPYLILYLFLSWGLHIKMVGTQQYTPNNVLLGDSLSLAQGE